LLKNIANGSENNLELRCLSNDYNKQTSIIGKSVGRSILNRLRLPLVK
jgi:hypothetical protein